MPRRKNPTSSIIKKASRKLQEKANWISADIKESIRNGATAEFSVRSAVIQSDWVNLVESETGKSAAAAYVLVTGKKSESTFIRKRWLSQTFDGLSLSQRIRTRTADGAQRVVGIVREQMEIGRAWNTAARNVRATGEMMRDVARPIIDLYAVSRQALRGDAAAQAQYRGAIEKARRHIDRLIDAGGERGQLKRAYQSIIDATESENMRAIDRAIDRAIRSKMLYNAQRIMRTETARAWGQARFNEMFNDTDVVAYKWELSSAHQIFDICDLHAGADLYGLGSGVYPIDKGPEYPAHPNCLCNISEIYRNEIGIDRAKSAQFDPNGGEKWLDSLDEIDRKSILGVAGEHLWEDGADWQTVAMNYNGQPGHKPNSI